jgi:hypothetical protein
VTYHLALKYDGPHRDDSGTNVSPTTRVLQMPTSMFLALLMAVCADGAPSLMPCPLHAADTCSSYPPDGRRYDSTITPEMRVSSPDWLESDANPPLSARRAIMLAETTLRATLKDQDESGKPDVRYMTGANLVPLGGRKWAWKVAYIWLPRIGGLRGKPFSFHVFVLMDGTAVKPKAVIANDGRLDSAPREKRGSIR